MYDTLLNIYGSLTWILPFLVVLTVLVFFHELGHYISARRHGVKVTTFSIGFGPEIFGFTDKVGTRWKFSLIPLGGYVQMFGDADATSRPDNAMQQDLSSEELQHTLNAKSVWKRMEVSAAGPTANLLLTAIFLAIVFWQTGQKTFAPILGDIKTNSAAEKAGLQAEDHILSINNIPVERFRQVQHIVSQNPGKTLMFKVQRYSSQTAQSSVPANAILETNASVGIKHEVNSNNPQNEPFKTEIFTLPITPESTPLSSTKIIGVIGAEPKNIHHTFFSAIRASFIATYEMSVDMFRMFGKFITGKEDSSQLGSLFSIAKMSHDMWEGGIFSLLFFMAILSLNLGIINLLPVPMLDGGHIFIYLIEAIRGKPLGLKTQEWFYKIGFGLVSSVMLYTLWNDVKRFAVLTYIANIFKTIIGD